MIKVLGQDRPDGWDIVQEINQLRRNMLVHSCIYYELNDNIISDHQWTYMAKRLARIQKRAFEAIGPFETGVYDEAFKDWDGSTGHHLPLQDLWVMVKARQLLGMEKRK